MEGRHYEKQSLQLNNSSFLCFKLITHSRGWREDGERGDTGINSRGEITWRNISILSSFEDLEVTLT